MEHSSCSGSEVQSHARSCLSFQMNSRRSSLQSMSNPGAFVAAYWFAPSIGAKNRSSLSSICLSFLNQPAPDGTSYWPMRRVGPAGSGFPRLRLSNCREAS